MDNNLILKNIFENLLDKEREELLSLVKDALKRGYSLGFSDGISMSKGRPQSSDSDYAIKHYIDTLKELYIQ